jgi:hypothetical protein
MAQGSLGDLVLSLSADTAKFQSDLGKANREAERFGAEIGTMLGRLGAAFLAIAGPAAMGAMLKQTVAMQSQLDDLADTVGGSVTQLDALRRVAVVSGNDLSQVSTALVQLSRSLRASSDDGNAAVRAVRALGLNLEELRNMAPDQAFKKIAVAMNQFADGGEKAAVAQALFGRSGAQLLPMLKDLAEAGEANGRVTREQAEQSERLEKETRRMGLAFSDVRDDIANKVIPIFADWFEQLREGVRIFGSVSSALYQIGTINPFKSQGANIQSLTADIEHLQQVIEVERSRGKGTTSFEQAIEDKKKKIEFLKLMQRQEAQQLMGPGSLDARDLQANPVKPNVNFLNDEDARRRAAEAARRAAAEAERERIRLLKMAAKSEEEYLLAQQAEIDFNDELQRQHVARMRSERERLEALQEQSEMQFLLAQHAKLEEQDEITRQSIMRSRKQEIKEMNDLAKTLGFTFTSAFEDAVLAGKKLSEVLKGLEQDIARIILRKTVTEPLANAIAGAIGGVFGGGGEEELVQLGGPRAFGGPVSGGMSYQVGEYGPEVFTPSVSGMITPESGGITVINNNYIDSRTDQASIALMMKATEDRTVAKIRQMQQRTGETRV